MTDNEGASQQADMPAESGSSNQDLVILRRLISSLQFAARAAEEGDDLQYFIVSVPDTEPPSVTVCDTLVEVAGVVDRLRQLQVDDPEGDYYTFVFYGRRVDIVKTQPWRVVDRGSYAAISSDVSGVPPSEDGSLRDIPRLTEAPPSDEDDVDDSSDDEEDDGTLSL